MVLREEEPLSMMRAERNTYPAVYMDFVQMSKFYSTHAFCFYEGEDGKYYNSRIRREFEDNFISFRVGNKKEVLKLIKKIRENESHYEACLMFFVDRDFDFSGPELNHKVIVDKDLYVTPCYSVENLYVSPSCLGRILQSEFLINQYDSDYKKCINDFVSLSNSFNEIIVEFNAIKLLHDKKSKSNSEYDFPDKNNRFLRFNIDLNKNGNQLQDFITLIKSTDYDNEIQKMLFELKIEISDFEKAKDELASKDNKNYLFRGKNQLHFFVEFIASLRQLNKREKYFRFKRNCVHIAFNGNWLSEISQYADEPKSLIEFIKNHKTILDTISLRSII